MSTEMLQDLDTKIRDAKRLLAKVEDRAIRLREAINTFKAEKMATESATVRVGNSDASPAA
jgi:hypothetical protein